MGVEKFFKYCVFLQSLLLLRRSRPPNRGLEGIFPFFYYALLLTPSTISSTSDDGSFPHTIVSLWKRPPLTSRRSLSLSLPRAPDDNFLALRLFLFVVSFFSCFPLFSLGAADPGFCGRLLQLYLRFPTLDLPQLCLLAVVHEQRVFDFLIFPRYGSSNPLDFYTFRPSCTAFLISRISPPPPLLIIYRVPSVFPPSQPADHESKGVFPPAMPRYQAPFFSLTEMP